MHLNAAERLPNSPTTPFFLAAPLSNLPLDLNRKPPPLLPPLPLYLIASNGLTVTTSRQSCAPQSAKRSSSCLLRSPSRRVRSPLHISVLITSTARISTTLPTVSSLDCKASPPSPPTHPPLRHVDSTAASSSSLPIDQISAPLLHILRICSGQTSRLVIAAVASFMSLCASPASAADATRGTPEAAPAPPGAGNSGIVIFDKDFAASWEGGTAAPLRISPTPDSSERLLGPPPGESAASKSPGTGTGRDGTGAIEQPRAGKYKKFRGPGGLPTPSLALEAQILSRLLVALVVGGVIGMERRAANSLAGVRTFSLVSLGAAIFMSTTLTAFPMSDPTRVAAAISSSVGFLGAGAMHKNAKHSRGLTTATSVWLAAALGIAAAAGLFLLSFSGAVATVLIARYARFDSSLHLIKGDPVLSSLQMDSEKMVDELHDDEDLINEVRASAAAQKKQQQQQQQQSQLQSQRDQLTPPPSSNGLTNENEVQGHRRTHQRMNVEKEND